MVDCVGEEGRKWREARKAKGLTRTEVRRSIGIDVRSVEFGHCGLSAEERVELEKLYGLKSS